MEHKRIQEPAPRDKPNGDFTKERGQVEPDKAVQPPVRPAKEKDK